MLLLVLLRLSIGLHFFTEGYAHYRDKNWSAEHFLKTAKGPAASSLKAVMPQTRDWNELLLSHPAERNERPGAQEPVKAGGEKATLHQKWINTVVADLENQHDLVVKFYDLDKAEKAKSLAVLDEFKARVKESIGGYRNEINNYDEQFLSVKLPYDPSTTTTFERPDQRELKKQAAEAVAEIRNLEQQYRTALLEIVDEADRETYGSPFSPRMLAWINFFTKYGIMAIGVCLVLGLFTRLAAFGAGMFLASVIVMSPLDALVALPLGGGPPQLPKYVFVEMLAALTLATTAVGRWGGLDFFIHYLIVRPVSRAVRPSTRQQGTVS